MLLNKQLKVGEFQALNTSKIRTKDKHTADNHLTTTNVSQNFAAHFLKSFLNMKRSYLKRRNNPSEQLFHTKGSQ